MMMGDGYHFEEWLRLGWGLKLGIGVGGHGGALHNRAELLRRGRGRGLGDAGLMIRILVGLQFGARLEGAFLYHLIETAVCRPQRSCNGGGGAQDQ